MTVGSILQHNNITYLPAQPPPTLVRFSYNNYIFLARYVTQSLLGCYRSFRGTHGTRTKDTIYKLQCTITSIHELIHDYTAGLSNTYIRILANCFCVRWCAVLVGRGKVEFKIKASTFRGMRGLV